MTTMQSVNTEFDFDEWVRLAKEDPDAFESMRKRMIQEVLGQHLSRNKAPHGRLTVANRPNSLCCT